jgi:hypothetical protein
MVSTIPRRRLTIMSLKKSVKLKFIFHDEILKIELVAESKWIVTKDADEAINSGGGLYC